MRWFFILLPWIELFTLIRLGASIGAAATLLYVFATLMLGLTLMRVQGVEVLKRLQEAELGWSVPPRAMIDEMAVGMAGLLLAIPGLVTDTLGLLLLVGPLLRRLSGQPRPERREAADAPPRAGTTVDGEFQRLDDD